MLKNTRKWSRQLNLASFLPSILVTWLCAAIISGSHYCQSEAHFRVGWISFWESSCGGSSAILSVWIVWSRMMFIGFSLAPEIFQCTCVIVVVTRAAHHATIFPKAGNIPVKKTGYPTIQVVGRRGGRLTAPAHSWVLTLYAQTIFTYLKVALMRLTHRSSILSR